jgi:diaminopimelate epimerase
MVIPFVKMHGAANDFVVVDHRRPYLRAPLAPLVTGMCDRRRGIGADGVLLLEADPELDFAMRYFNSDGHPADWCGNGARCLARFALDLGLGRAGRVRFRTAVGAQEAGHDPGGAGIELHYGVVAPGTGLDGVAAAERTFAGLAIAPGVPHFVTDAGDPDDVPVAEWGAALRRHPRFGAAGTNVDFVRAEADGVRLRTFERGVEAETMACGSGAIAAALWAAGRGAASPVRVRTAGGDVLIVSYATVPGGYDVRLTGPAERAFAGEWPGPEAERCG